MLLKQLIDLCVSRRFAVIAFTAGIAVFGFRAYEDTPIEAFPDVTNYQINVISDAVSSPHRDAHEYALSFMQQYHRAEIITSEEAIERFRSGTALRTQAPREEPVHPSYSEWRRKVS